MHQMRSVREHPVVSPLHYHDVAKVVKVRDAAFAPLPLVRYLLETPDAKETRATKLVRNVAEIMLTASYVRRHEGLVIDGGEGLALYLLERHRKLERAWFTALMKSYTFLWMLLSSREQKARMKEITIKAQEASKGAIRDPDEYLEIIGLDTLAVFPDRQGLGYGSSLVSALTTMADTQRRSILLSTHLETAGFYEQFGFAVRAHFLLGDHNPTWTKAPVHMVIMIREPSTACKHWDSKAYV